MENNYLEQGFKNGYFLAKQNKELLDGLMNLHHHPDYLEGLKKGIAEFKKTLEIEKLKNRRNKLKKIKEREQGKEELER
jgi:hypothetical protein